MRIYGGKPWAWMYTFNVDENLCKQLHRGDVEHLGIVQQLMDEYKDIRRIMFDRYHEHVDALATEGSCDQ